MHTDRFFEDILLNIFTLVFEDIQTKFSSAFFFFLFQFNFWPCWVSVAAQAFSLVAVSRDFSLVVVHGLLFAVVSLVVKHDLQGIRTSVVAALKLQSTGLVVVAHRLICSVACGIFLDQGSNLCSIDRHSLYHWATMEALVLSFSAVGMTILSLSGKCSLILPWRAPFPQAIRLQKCSLTWFSILFFHLSEKETQGNQSD